VAHNLWVYLFLSYPCAAQDRIVQKEFLKIKGWILFNEVNCRMSYRITLKIEVFLRSMMVFSFCAKYNKNWKILYLSSKSKKSH